jgi:hypothetical protein
MRGSCGGLFEVKASFTYRDYRRLRIRHVKLVGALGSQKAKKCENWLPNFEITYKNIIV